MNEAQVTLVLGLYVIVKVQVSDSFRGNRGIQKSKQKEVSEKSVSVVRKEKNQRFVIHPQGTSEWAVFQSGRWPLFCAKKGLFYKFYTRFYSFKTIKNGSLVPISAEYCSWAALY